MFQLLKDKTRRKIDRAMMMLLWLGLINAITITLLNLYINN